MAQLTMEFDDHGLIKKFEGSGSVVHAELNKGLQAGAAVMERAVVEHTPVGATSMLSQSITHQLYGGGASLEARVFSNDEPIKVLSVETGRAPGKMPPWRPGSALHTWVVRMVGGDERTAFLIARAIGRRGTRGKWMFRKGFQSGRPQVERIFDQVVANIARRL